MKNSLLVVIVVGFVLLPNCTRKITEPIEPLPELRQMKMVYVPAGTFQRDSDPANTSYVSAFYISDIELTRGFYSLVTGITFDGHPAHKHINYPVENVSLFQAMIFCNKLSMREGLSPVYRIAGSTNPDNWPIVPYGETDFSFHIWENAEVIVSANGYRLPTEMEWMWAAMGADSENPGKVNTTGYTKLFAGSNGSNNIEDYVWTKASALTYYDVATKLPNELGLYDMSGNIGERCWDRFEEPYPSGHLIDYMGAASGSLRVTKGGCSYSWVETYSIVDRFLLLPAYNFQEGFRIVRRQ